MKLNINNEHFEVEWSGTNESPLVINNKESNLDLIRIDNNTYHIIKGHQSYLLEIIENVRAERKLVVRINSKKTEVYYKTKEDLLLESMGFDSMASQKMKDLKAPMPGLVVDILVKENQSVQKGDSLIVLEAMKMENVIKAAGEGTIKKITTKKGAAVEKNAVLITFE